MRDCLLTLIKILMCQNSTFCKGMCRAQLDKNVFVSIFWAKAQQGLSTEDEFRSHSLQQGSLWPCAFLRQTSVSVVERVAGQNKREEALHRRKTTLWNHSKQHKRGQMTIPWKHASQPAVVRVHLGGRRSRIWAQCFGRGLHLSPLMKYYV